MEFGFKQSEIQETLSPKNKELTKIKKGYHTIVDYLSANPSKDDLEGKIYEPRTLHFRKKLARALVDNGLGQQYVYSKLKL